MSGPLQLWDSHENFPVFGGLAGIVGPGVLLQAVKDPLLTGLHFVFFPQTRHIWGESNMVNYSCL